MADRRNTAATRAEAAPPVQGARAAPPRTIRALVRAGAARRDTGAAARRLTSDDVAAPARVPAPVPASQRRRQANRPAPAESMPARAPSRRYGRTCPHTGGSI